MNSRNSTDETHYLEAVGSPHACVYLPDETARLSYVYPRHYLSLQELDRQLALGRRRSGPFLYYMNCQACRACQPTRIVLSEFQLTTSLKRVLKRGDAQITTTMSSATVDRQRVSLYNLHRLQRGLGDEGTIAGVSEYREFLIDSCCNTMELSYHVNGLLVGCTIVDVGAESLSAVYTFFDPQYARLSVGSYAVLKLIQFAKAQQMQYVYLGLYVASNSHLRYKSRYVPQERLIDGQWIRFNEPGIEWSSGTSVTNDL